MSTWQSPKLYASAVLVLDERVTHLQSSWSSTREASDSLAEITQLLLELRQINQDLFADRERILSVHTKYQAPYARWRQPWRSKAALEALAAEREKTLEQYDTLKTHIDQTLKHLETKRKSLRSFLKEQKKRTKKTKPPPATSESFAPVPNGKDEDVASWWDFAKTAVVTDQQKELSVCSYCAGRIEPGTTNCTSCGKPVSLQSNA